MDSVQLLKTRSAEQRRALMAELASNLKLHMTIEEEIFYPAGQQLPAKKAEEMALEAPRRLRLTSRSDRAPAVDARRCR